MKGLLPIVAVTFINILGIAGCNQVSAPIPKPDITETYTPKMTAQQAQGIVVSAVQASTPTIQRQSHYFRPEFNKSTRQWMVAVWASENDSKSFAGMVYVVEDATAKLLNPPPVHNQQATQITPTAQPILVANVTPNATKEAETWKAYNSTAFAYSIEYPSTWKLAENGGGTTGVVLISYNGVSVAISPPHKSNTSLSVSVDSLIKGSTQVYSYYNVVERKTWDWQGKYEACLLRVETQDTVDTPLRKSASLHVVRNGNYYFLSVGATKWVYEQYSSTIDKIIFSFQLNQ